MMMMSNRFFHMNMILAAKFIQAKMNFGIVLFYFLLIRIEICFQFQGVSDVSSFFQDRNHYFKFKKNSFK
jgi:hypothetical protein